jgi:flavin reductase (DIM6/NTAB) family NADH-FMN oxidoreductase RutF
MDEAATQAKRTLLRMVPYGLYVVTVRGVDGEVNGFTANWLAQAGFEPPMLALAVAADAHSLPMMRASERFAVNFIPDGGVDLLRRLGRPHFKAPDKLEGLPLREAAYGTPVLKESLGYVECAIRGELVYGADHQIVVGEIVDAQILADGELQTMRVAGFKYSG